MSIETGRVCTAECWTPTYCAVCYREMQPAGRSVAIEAYGSYCNEDCQGYREDSKRHLWSEHDSTRRYTDPDGWAAHEADCEQCGGR